MWTDWNSGTFALPCGADFCRSFVDGLMQRVAGKPPEALAEVTIYLNALTTLKTLRRVFDDYAVRNGPLLLPKLRLIPDIGASLPGERAAPLARELDLGNLVSRLLATDPGLGTGQSVPELAESLAALMRDMQSEGCDAESLNRIDAREHAAHWQRSLAFLKIAAEFYLVDPPVDPTARQRQMAEALSAAWAAGEAMPDAPVLAVGSTGSHGATRVFLRAVAALPLGAVVLPGYDFDQPEAVWETLLSGGDDHPQARLAALRGNGVRPWLALPKNDRNKLTSLALRPAPVTDQWIADGPTLPDLSAPTQRMTLIEADQPQEEADAIALLIRDAVAQERAIRIFAADRGLVRRIAASLDRWGLVIDDSAGEPLQLTAHGLFLRHVAGLFERKMTVDQLLIILKDPITATGSDKGNSLRHARELELHLRRHGPAFPDGESLRGWGDKGDDSRKIWVEWLSEALNLVSQAEREVAPRPLADRIERHLSLAGLLAGGAGGEVGKSRLWSGTAGKLTLAAMNLLAEHADRAQPLGPRDYADLIDNHLRSHQARRSRENVHPLIRACGTGEARTEVNLSDNAIVILAGLNEGGWPQPLPPDPWLSRNMRKEAGLPLPERRIGLSAHDFQQAIAAPEVVLSRARRDAEAETIPSRWLNRLINLMSGLPDQSGPQALADMRRRGDRWLGLAHQLARPRFTTDPAPRPAPVPPAPAFDTISVTQVSKLIRDPYAVYAQKVLNLRPLDPLRPEPGAALRGQVLHLVAERLLTPPPEPGISFEELRARFLDITDQVLAEEVPWPAARAFWQARMVRIADQITRDELTRIQRGRPVVVEATRRLPVPGLNLSLTAKPDRIDLLDGGALAHVYDYKSGTPPTNKQMAKFDKQLLLEAAMVREGAFPDLGPVPVEGVSYIQLGGEGLTHDRDFSNEAAQETWAKFVILAQRYLTQGQGFAARRAMEKAGDTSDYDHLSRYGEWGEGDAPVTIKVGDHDA
ncbi:double-strand break repair protein AddB [Paracoccus sp. SCSIO 75233]|uniref:double-strand break repair protein AddB n=1 Tax=Paracoccus sp. SCSIO 75233 TaxID=3017782 RepID=UPI0022EFDA4C|nr:double-strand break repair protein AddB [Paracoccus sp. SCSIO 75233]WBU52904.1 double-strand break repair protein AddB [Paracoccus sp. SCSIO 75233]